MAIAHNLGFPRIGAKRELKRALEAYWKGEQDQAALEAVGRELCTRHWKLQAAFHPSGYCLPAPCGNGRRVRGTSG